MDKYMQRALNEAKATLAEGGHPYGAVIVRGTEIIGVGRNLMTQNNDPTSHGEIEALRNAGLQESFADTVMYTTAFPCLMCAGAIVKLGLPTVIIGAAWDGCESSQQFMAAHSIELEILDIPECQALLED